MLSLVVMQERPELEETRSALVVASAQMKRELKEIEDRILYRLSLSEGSAVDDVDLILTLEASKVKSEEIKVRRCRRRSMEAPGSKGRDEKTRRRFFRDRPRSNGLGRLPGMSSVGWGLCPLDWTLVMRLGTG